VRERKSAHARERAREREREREEEIEVSALARRIQGTEQIKSNGGHTGPAV